MKLAVVTPWFGAELRGGAERVAWEAATGLARRGHDVTALTTCSRAFTSNWAANDYKPGTTFQDGITVTRFVVRPRSAQHFNRVNQKLVSLPISQLKRGLNPVSEHDAQVFCDDNINSDALLAHLRDCGSLYDAVLFLPYLYGPTLNGWHLVADRAFVQPCLHEEGYAYLPAVAEMMRGSRGLLFNSEGELDLARRLYGPGIDSRSTVVGSAIELSTESTASGRGTINGVRPEKERYILYLGRRANTKNVDFLVAVFRSFKSMYPQSELKLILGGTGTTDYSDSGSGIHDLGFVSESDKLRLLRSCLALAQPSINESYSRSMMEAWLFGRPVVVHAKSAATSQAMRSTASGWIADSHQDWLGVIAFLDSAEPSLLDSIGAKAAEYVRAFASWPGVLDRYELAFGVLSRPEEPDKQFSLHQALDEFKYGDAISIQAMGLRDALIRSGRSSSIFARRVDPRLTQETAEGEPAKDVAVLVHLQEGCSVQAYAHLPNPKLLVVHGQPALDDELLSFAQECSTVFASSPATRRDLSRRLRGDVLPFAPIANPSRWNIAADSILLSALQDGKTNILCVDAIRPGNNQHALLEVFTNYLSLDLNARLILAGRYEAGDPYYQSLVEIVAGSSLSRHVLITGLVSEPALAALYGTAHVYCTLSESHLTGAALIEAMLFDVPVCAFNTEKSAAILQHAGLLIKDVGDLLGLAALLKVVATDAGTRSALLKSQQTRRLAFNYDAIVAQAANLAAYAEAAVAAGRA